MTVLFVTRAISGESICGDAWAVRALAPEDSRGDHPPVLVMLCDGLGHGPLAAHASAVAASVFRTTAAQRPQEIMELLHTELRGGDVADAAEQEPAVSGLDQGDGATDFPTPADRTPWEELRERKLAQLHAARDHVA